MRQMWLLVVLSTVASLSSAAIWSNSNPRGELLSQLAEAGFAQQEQLLQIQKLFWPMNQLAIFIPIKVKR